MARRRLGHAGLCLPARCATLSNASPRLPHQLHRVHCRNTPTPPDTLFTQSYASNSTKASTDPRLVSLHSHLATSTRAPGDCHGLLQNSRLLFFPLPFFCLFGNGLPRFPASIPMPIPILSSSPAHTNQTHWLLIVSPAPAQPAGLASGVSRLLCPGHCFCFCFCLPLRLLPALA
jgi:hypothetical protein